MITVIYIQKSNKSTFSGFDFQVKERHLGEMFEPQESSLSSFCSTFESLLSALPIFPLMSIPHSSLFRSHVCGLDKIINTLLKLHFFSFLTLLACFSSITFIPLPFLLSHPPSLIECMSSDSQGTLQPALARYSTR